MPFAPRGETSQWMLIFRVLEAQLLKEDPTEIITWDDFEAQCGFDVRTARSAVYKASDEMLKKHSRTAVSVRGEGYRLDEPSARLTLVREQEKRGLNHYVNAEELATNIPVDLLTAEQVKALELRKRSLMNINNALNRHEDAIVANRDYVVNVDQRLTTVEERLRSLGVLRDEHAETVEGEVVDTQA